MRSLSRVLLALGLASAAAGLLLLAGCRTVGEPAAAPPLPRLPTPAPSPSPDDPFAEYAHLFRPTRSFETGQEARAEILDLDRKKALAEADAASRARIGPGGLRGPRDASGRGPDDHGHPRSTLEKAFHFLGEDYLALAQIVGRRERSDYEQTARYARDLFLHATEIAEMDYRRNHPYGERFARLAACLQQDTKRLELAARASMLSQVELYWDKVTIVAAGMQAILLPPLPPGVEPGMIPASEAGPPVPFPSPLPDLSEYEYVEELPFVVRVRNPVFDAEPGKEPDPGTVPFPTPGVPEPLAPRPPEIPIAPPESPALPPPAGVSTGAEREPAPEK